MNEKYVYFLKEKGTNYVKIGLSKWEGGRADELQTGNPRELLCLTWFKGDKDTEQFIHKILDNYRAESEWFLLPKELIHYLYKLGERREKSQRNG